MRKIIESPYTDGTATLTSKVKIREFRKEKYQIWEHYYICDSTKKEFTTPEIDKTNINQVYNQYREKHNIIFPEQIIELRSKYGLKLTQMSKILGLGVNMIRNYENGEMPNHSNATLLGMIKDPVTFQALFRRKMNYLDFSKKKIDEILSTIDNHIHNLPLVHKPCFSSIDFPNEYSGYAMPSFEKRSNMVIFFLNKLNFLFKVKLNKLLFYSDFHHFKKTGKSISGTQYVAIPMGPVPDKYLHFYASMVDEDYIELTKIHSEEYQQDIEKMEPLKSFNEEIFTAEEAKTLNIVLDQLGRKSRDTVVQKSHEEKCWKEQEPTKGFISYQKYAFELKGIDF